MKRQMTIHGWIGFAGLGLFLCAGCSYRPVGAFQATHVPERPDYANPLCWAALPSMLDSADVVPDSTLENRQDIARADVFYLYPTTYTGKRGQKSWNADVYDQKLNERTDKTAIRNQASVFNGACRVYAPRYRQAHLESFYTKRRKEDARKALALAYQDVRVAFVYYLSHYNAGRPFIIAGHSQGTLHAVQLLQEFYERKNILPDLIAAYLVGMPIDTGTFSRLQQCLEPDDVDCFCTWRTVHEKYKPGPLYPSGEGYLVTNPLTWSADNLADSREDHHGAVLLKFYDGLIPGLIDATAEDGLLRISKPKIPGVPILFTRNYHVADYNLFYADIRHNVDDRVNAYFSDEARVIRPK